VAQGGAAERGAGWRRVARHVSKSPANQPRQRKRNKIPKIPIANALIFRKAIVARNFLAHSS
jgi:hypothetical protein